MSEVLESSELPDQILQQQETLAQIQQCIDFLPEGCRTVFILSRYENAKYKDISEKLGISVKTVENQMGRALRLLRECLKPLFLTLSHYEPKPIQSFS